MEFCLSTSILIFHSSFTKLSPCPTQRKLVKTTTLPQRLPKSKNTSRESRARTSYHIVLSSEPVGYCRKFLRIQTTRRTLYLNLFHGNSYILLKSLGFVTSDHTSSHWILRVAPHVLYVKNCQSYCPTLQRMSTHYSSRRFQSSFQVVGSLYLTKYYFSVLYWL